MTRKTSPASAAPAPARPAGPGRPKDLAKRASILDAAKRLFVEQGYQGVSMDQIAAAAGVSKLTVYSHFGDKETLFSAAIAAKCREVLPDDLFVRPPDGPLHDQLCAIGHAFFRLITSEEAISMHRMMSTPGTAENDLRELFWEAGPRRTQEVFGGFLQACVDAGQLRIDDVPLASSQFFSLLKGELHPMLICGLRAGHGPGEVARHIDATVEFFLRAYAA
ncbi:TetR family transcriptional regulator [Pseudoxanthomonas broegbernensis]|uniref:TetR family transcriptional regulator n=1 Tax=Pseudoxanthomonas broegbernensis TaxID=83619 RepID=A0A7V8GNN1_9GAMM|nr:TetR/AcrR family transcriptional regulator [Pseudoxanthomonas broegbernensis]KAF1687258.1 TetR family transcriptional regulator [Pseudoxanthomonas broegbernensis]MBB6065751.1 TetR/AcrR family transcriptional repressor of mexJK operon [Pseudoxanthomonas broegbernensis]